jgi:hypothetical protein
MTNTETPITFSKLSDGKFFILDGITYCRFGSYGLGFHNGENVFKIVDPKTLVNPIELKDALNIKNK